MVGAIVLIVFYLVAALRRLPRLRGSPGTDAQRSLMPPQAITWFDDGRFAPYVYALKGTRDPMTFKRVYVPDTRRKIPVVLFGQGDPYKLLGLIPTDRHLIAVEGAKAEESLFLLGTDMRAATCGRG